MLRAIQLGIDHGDLPASTNAETAAMLLYGPITAEYMLHDPLPLAQVESMVAIVLSGLRNVGTGSDESKP